MKRKTWTVVLIQIVLLVGCAVYLLPFLWLVTTSFKENDEILKFPPVWIPSVQMKYEEGGKKYPVSTIKLDGKAVKVLEMERYDDGKCQIKVAPGEIDEGRTIIVDGTQLTKVRKHGLRWENYTDAMNALPKEAQRGVRYLFNTVLITILSIIGTLISSSMVAYSFARLNWPFKGLSFAVLLSTMMIPAAVTMIPTFLIFRQFGWIDTLLPLWVPAFFAAPFGVFLLRQFMLSIPRDLDEAAILDGASFWGVYWHIILPLVKPALLALGIMTFMGAWNNFMGPLIYINSPENMTLSYALQLFRGENSVEFGMVMAASVMVVIPVIVIFFVAQKHFIEGVTLTGIKG